MRTKNTSASWYLSYSKEMKPSWWKQVEVYELHSRGIEEENVWLSGVEKCEVVNNQ